jgi:hypothetical protein
MHAFKPFFVTLGITLMVLISSYIVMIRPWHLRWGATDREVEMVLPGDTIAAPDAVSSTRAITILAPAPGVWAWLEQTGQNRGGGWHSYAWLENLFAADMHPIEAINPGLPELHVGDTLYMHVGAATNPIMAVTVESIEKERTLVLRGGWTFLLMPLSENKTRLIVRYPMRPNEFGHPLLTFPIFEPVHFVMESGMMLGLKANAEQAVELGPELADTGGGTDDGAY